MSTQAQLSPGAARWWPDWLTFPSPQAAQHQTIVRGLVALMWLATPAVYYLLATTDGGFGRLILKPGYFILAVVYLLLAVIVVGGICLVMVWLHPARAGVAVLAEDGGPGSAALLGPERRRLLTGARRRMHRDWMLASVACFAATAIVLALSTLINKRVGTGESVDLLSDALGMGSGLGWLVMTYLQTLAVTVVVSIIVRWRARRRAGADAYRALGAAAEERRGGPNLLGVAFLAYVILLGLLALSTLPVPRFLA